MNNSEVRIYELAKELNLDIKEIVAICDQINITFKSYSSRISESEAESIRKAAEKLLVNNLQQPREYDAVFGGNISSLEGAAVLGGVEGVRMRLSNPDPKVRITALQQALNYGEQALDVVIHSLQDESPQVQIQAYSLLTSRTELKVKQALLNFNSQGLKLEPIEVVTVNIYGEIIQREQRLAKYFTEDLGNGVTLDMAAIPGGTFIMGATETEEHSYKDERPQHQVTVQPLFIGKYQVTQAQWRAIAALPKVNRELQPEPSLFKGHDSPVEQISWDDAVEFCSRLSRKTGKKYRLPSEAEWEYACRAGTTTPFHFGETITGDLGNYEGHFKYGQGPYGVRRGKTITVGSFPPNAFGLYDMHGNVDEWCADTSHENYIGAPTDGNAWIDNNDYRMMRGGSWFDYSRDCRSAHRSRFSSSYNKHGCPGFRVVCSLAINP